jgi:hypothetical protein
MQGETLSGGKVEQNPCLQANSAPFLIDFENDMTSGNSRAHGNM